MKKYTLIRWNQNLDGTTSNLGQFNTIDEMKKAIINHMDNVLLEDEDYEFNWNIESIQVKENQLIQNQDNWGFGNDKVFIFVENN